MATLAGKVDWLARELSTEGDQEPVPLVKDVVREDVTLARLDQQVGEVRVRVDASRACSRSSSAKMGTLLARLRKRALEGDVRALAKRVMEPGPSTIRLDTAGDKLARRLRVRGLKTAVATDPEGKLVDVVRMATRSLKGFRR